MDILEDQYDVVDENGVKEISVLFKVKNRFFLLLDIMMPEMTDAYISHDKTMLIE